MITKWHGSTFVFVATNCATVLYPTDTTAQKKTFQYKSQKLYLSTINHWVKLRCLIRKFPSIKLESARQNGG